MSTLAETKNPFVEGDWFFDKGAQTITSPAMPGLTVSIHSDPLVPDAPDAETCERMGIALRTYLQQAHRFQIDEWLRTGHPPRMFLTIDESELDQVVVESVLTIEVKRKDGKIGRIHLSIAPSNGGVRVRVGTPSRNKDYTKESMVHFADWSK